MKFKAHIKRLYNQGYRQLSDIHKELNQIEEIPIATVSLHYLRYLVEFVYGLGKGGNALSKLPLQEISDHFKCRWEELFALYVLAVENNICKFKANNKIKKKEEWADFVESVKLLNPILRMSRDYSPKQKAFVKSKGTGRINPSPAQQECSWAIWDAMDERLYYDEEIGYNTAPVGGVGKGWKVTEIIILAHRQWGKTEIIASTFSAKKQALSETDLSYITCSFAPTGKQHFIAEHVTRHLLIDAHNHNPLATKYVASPRYGNLGAQPAHNIKMKNGKVYYRFSGASGRTKEGGGKHGDSTDCTHVDEMQLLPDDIFLNELEPLRDASDVGLLVVSGTTNEYPGCTIFKKMVDESRKSIQQTGHPPKGTFFIEVDCYRSLAEGMITKEDLEERKRKSPSEFAKNYELKWSSDIQRDYWNENEMKANVKKYSPLLNATGEKEDLAINVACDVHESHIETIVGSFDKKKLRYKILRWHYQEFKSIVDEDDRIRHLEKIYETCIEPFSTHHNLMWYIDAGGIGKAWVQKAHKLYPHVRMPTYTTFDKVLKKNVRKRGVNPGNHKLVADCADALNDLFKQGNFHMPQTSQTSKFIKECESLEYLPSAKGSKTSQHQWKNLNTGDHWFTTARMLMIPYVKERDGVKYVPKRFDLIISTEPDSGVSVLS